MDFEDEFVGIIINNFNTNESKVFEYLRFTFETSQMKFFDTFYSTSFEKPPLPSFEHDLRIFLNSTLVFECKIDVIGTQIVTSKNAEIKAFISH